MSEKPRKSVSFTISIPKHIYNAMQHFPEVRWSVICRKAIVAYIKKMEGMNTHDL